ncbi:MAG: flagellar basal body P-ring formation chaperone FlgA [Holosporales bacterium]|jgi:flagella basal body P-ring formation protein FlgA|nr:flagellar basal body P-ring formation chaperone FlgA [Holosporales bacterium]
MARYCVSLLFLFLQVSGHADIIVHKEEVYLSDLFELPEGTQDVAVMPAPSCGQRQEIPVSFLKTLAQRYRLSCENMCSVWVERAASPADAQVVRTVRVPTLVASKHAGETIFTEDLDWTEVRENHIRQDVIRNPEEVIGKIARLAMRATVPIRFADIRNPVVIRRNASVVLRVQMQNLQATIRGKALEDGGCGDTIRVVNTQSGKIIEGIVYNDKIIDITPI